MQKSVVLNSLERKIVLLAALGGMLEFYDFIIYGVFSLYFVDQFFPSGNQFLSIIEGYVVFILGYVARPIGGIFFSHVGDEYGRKKVLIITIILMGASSLGIGILPSYDKIGYGAPILLLCLRLLQGVALGGELPSTYVYISESMPLKRGTAFGITMAGVNAGLLLGMLVNQLLNVLMSSEALHAYGWRLPFLFGGILCFISYKVRKSFQETADFNKIRNKPEFPLFYLLRHHFPQFIAGTAMTAIMSALVIIAVVFMPTYLHELLKIDGKFISHLMPIVMLLNVIVIYITGRVANIIKPAKILATLLFSCFFLIPASYYLIHNNYLIPGLLILGSLEGVAAMLIPLLITCLFPAKIRLTGVALCYNAGFTLFGGLAPIILLSSVKHGYGVFMSPVIYLMGIIVVCALGLFYAKRYSFEKISS